MLVENWPRLNGGKCRSLAQRLASGSAVFGTVAGLTRIVVTESAMAAGTDSGLSATTCSVPPLGRYSPSLTCRADCACATVPDASTVKLSRWVTVRPELLSQPLTAAC